jgi:hypothetical protein
MTATSHSAPIKFAGSTLGDFHHICAFFSSQDEEYRTTLPFMRDGLAAGDRLVNFVPQDRTDHDDRLRAGGIDVDGSRKTRQLENFKSEDAYIEKNGHFDGESMLRLVPQILTSGRDLGFRMTRLIAHAEHVMKDANDADAFIEYESRLNYILPKYPDAVVCTYDLDRINAGYVMDVLRTHPLVVLGGLLQENRFFVPPDEFLREVAERRKSPNEPRGKPEKNSRSRKRR